MKKLITYATALVLTTMSSSFAQNNTQEYLNNAIQTAENIPQDVQYASNAIDRLVYELTSPELRMPVLSTTICSYW